MSSVEMAFLFMNTPNNAGLPIAVRDDLEAAKEALESLLVRKGSHSPLWAAVEAALAQIDLELSGG